MKNLWKTLFSFAVLMALTVPAFGKNDVQHERIAELDDLSFIEMLNSVDLGNGTEADLVRQLQAKEGKSLRTNNKYNQQSGNNIETFRNKEVLLITIPADKLFTPNSTELSPEAIQYLEPLRRYLRHPDMYRVLLTMHTDNTGSERYRDEITADRVNAIYDWFLTQGVTTTYLFPYALSDEMPLKSNDTMDNRRNNRRLEVYLVPGQKMLDAAKKGRIEF